MLLVVVHRGKRLVVDFLGDVWLGWGGLAWRVWIWIVACLMVWSCVLCAGEGVVQSSRCARVVVCRVGCCVRIV